jgi:muramidase (phage lysozyme)
LATFNPDVGGVPSANMPDQTGASRGIDTNRSFEYLFKGLGDAIGGVATAVDTDIKNTIRTDTQAGVDNYLKTYTDTIPAELAQSGSAMKSLQTALEQGKISDTYYYGQLTALTKKMRAKYPGYEEYVDETIQGITGVRPANAYRNALLQDIADEQNSASDEAKFARQWEKENEEYIAKIAPDYFDDPSKYDFDSLRTMVASRKAREHDIDAEKSRLELLSSQGKVNDEQASEVGMTTLNDVVQQTMYGTSNAMGLNGDDFMKKVTGMFEAGYTPEDYTALVGQMNSLEVNLRQSLLKSWTAPLTPGSRNSLSSMLPGKQKEMIEEAMAPFLAIKELVVNKDVGLATYYTRQLGITQDKTLTAILNKSPDLQTAMALKEISQDLALQFINESGKQEGIFASIAPEVAARVVTGQDDLNGAVDRVVTSPGSSADKVGFINSTLDSLLTTVKSGDVDPTQMSNTVKSLYALDATGHDVFSYVQTDQYMPLYNRMFNTEITTAIKTYGTPDDLNNYFAAARQRIFAIPELRAAAATFNETNSNWQEFFEVTSNPTSGRLELNVKKEGVPMFGGLTDRALQTGPLGAMAYTFDKQKAQAAINQVNTAFDTLGGIAEAMGVDPGMKAPLYGQVLKELNVELEQGNNEGFFKWLVDSVGAISQSDEEVGKQLDDISFNLGTDSGVMSDYYSKVGSAESGGNPNAANPNSSATGTYQFLDSTYNVYARRLGLKGDKNDPANQEAAMKAFTEDNAAYLSDNGIPLSNENLYAAHFLGTDDAKDVLTAPDEGLISDYVAPRVIKANSFLKDMTVLEFKRWLQRKVG